MGIDLFKNVGNRCSEVIVSEVSRVAVQGYVTPSVNNMLLPSDKARTRSQSTKKTYWVKFDEQIKELDGLKSENNPLKKEVSFLKKRVNSGEQCTREGVPETKSENLLEVDTKNSRVVAFNLEPSMVDAVHRLVPNIKNLNAPRGIIRSIDFRYHIGHNFLSQKSQIKDLGFMNGRIDCGELLSQLNFLVPRPASRIQALFGPQFARTSLGAHAPVNVMMRLGNALP
ncbi:hypothetical protein J6590_032347 [Homalodisca vitripennis]|nr:hypothetical protein J6590_032347 [Homalodisca vitripennis]